MTVGLLVNAIVSVGDSDGWVDVKGAMVAKRINVGLWEGLWVGLWVGVLG